MANQGARCASRLRRGRIVAMAIAAAIAVLLLVLLGAPKAISGAPETTPPKPVFVRFYEGNRVRVLRSRVTDPEALRACGELHRLRARLHLNGYRKLDRWKVLVGLGVPADLDIQRCSYEPHRVPFEVELPDGRRAWSCGRVVLQRTMLFEHYLELMAVAANDGELLEPAAINTGIHLE